MTWFYAEAGTRKGPVSHDELRRAVTRGEIDRDTLIWRQGMQEWLPLERIEELQPLLEHLPPPLPFDPPPLPDPAAAARGGDAAASRNPSEGGGRSESKRRRFFGKIGAVISERINMGVDWLGNKIGNALWDKLFSQPALVVTAISSVTVGTIYAYNHYQPKVPPPLGLQQTPIAAVVGEVRIDANPWGRVEWIRGSGGQVDLPQDRTTPFSISLPAGTYQAEVSYPQTRATQRCELRVQPDRPAGCWLDLAPVDARSYFDKIGW